MKMKIKRLDKSLDMPAYAALHDAAFDLRSRVDVEILPSHKAVVPTGLSMEIPHGYVGNIRGRSGLAAKNAIQTLAGIIDPGYRGEIGVVLLNSGHEAFMIEKGMRIAQMLIMPVVQVDFEEVEELSETQRGTGGFGHTGIK